MEDMHIAISLIVQDGHYLFQQRGIGDNIGSPGKIGCFGGKVEEGETATQAVCREINEETTLVSKPEGFHAIGSLTIRDSLRGVTYDIHVDAFRIEVPTDVRLEAREGGLVRVSFSQAGGILHKMTPATKQLFEQYVL